MSNSPYPTSPLAGRILQPQAKPALKRPDNHMVGAVLCTLFCFMPFGIVAIVKASNVDSAWAAGDYERAYLDSVSAKKWINRSVLISIIPLVIALCIGVAGAH